MIPGIALNPSQLTHTTNPTPLNTQPSTNLHTLLPSWVPTHLLDNPLFSAGFGLMGVGVCVGLLRNSIHTTSTLARRFLLTSLEIPSRDQSYSRVMQWLISRGTFARHFGVETKQVKDASGHTRHVYEFVPSTGRHIITFNNTFLIIERNREKTMVDLNSGTPWETLTLTTFAWDRSIFKILLREAQKLSDAKEEGKTVIYQSFGHEWRPFGNPKRIRPFQSVVLAEGVADKVLSDVKEFMETSNWYFDRGIPYRRGYLLHGPPGCGKSSYVMAVAGALQYNICMTNVGDPYLTDDRLIYLFATVPPRTLLLLEDIDGAVIASGNGNLSSNDEVANQFSKDSRSKRASLSGLLNALDGVAATEERIIFMTTNYPETLPEALVRPGRVDLKIRVGYATPYQIRTMYLRFFPGAHDQVDEFVNTLSGMNISMAELQGFFMFCKDGPDTAQRLANHWKSSEEQEKPEDKQNI